MLFEKRKKKIKVHIVGAGEIGRTLAAQLSQDDCEVTVVDTDAQVVNALSNSTATGATALPTPPWRRSRQAIPTSLSRSPTRMS